jgi:hypothetical protein
LDANKWPLLTHAVFTDNDGSMVSLLLNNRACVDAVNKDGVTALSIATTLNRTPSAIVLLKNNANPTIKSTPTILNKVGECALSESCLIDPSGLARKDITTLILMNPQIDAEAVASAYLSLECAKDVCDEDRIQKKRYLSTMRWLVYHGDKENRTEAIKTFDSQYKILPSSLLDIVISYGGLYHDVPKYPLPKRDPTTPQERAQLAEIKKALAVGYSIYSRS